ncbi:unnamed protein product [Toxocara canis]|uniref:Uncharacterized protein n=1 Tax=Toxocara canis TaxID=6265 RepID=A0A183TVH1_TOXCA|nr:unnamed protein product [Toxocara canis]
MGGRSKAAADGSRTPFALRLNIDTLSSDSRSYLLCYYALSSYHSIQRFIVCLHSTSIHHRSIRLEVARRKSTGTLRVDQEKRNAEKSESGWPENETPSRTLLANEGQLSDLVNKIQKVSESPEKKKQMPLLLPASSSLGGRFHRRENKQSKTLEKKGAIVVHPVPEGSPSNS